MPRLDTVKVEPSMSAGRTRPSRARATTWRNSAERVLSGFWSASRATTVSSPSSMATATPMLICPWRTIFLPPQGQGGRLDQEVVHRELLVLRHAAVEIGAQGHERPGIQIGGQIEVRQGLLGGGHTPSDDGPPLAELNSLGGGRGPGGPG